MKAILYFSKDILDTYINAYDVFNGYNFIHLFFYL